MNEQLKMETRIDQPVPNEEARRNAVATQALVELGQTAVPTPESNIFCLTIIGQIEGHMLLPPQNKTTKYEHVIPQLVAAEQNPKVEGLLLVLNTVGGDVEAGLAIAEMISSMSKPTVTIVLGGGHSIGVPIAVSGNYSIIAETATMTIHPIRMTGLVISVPQTFDYLEKMQERVVKFVARHSGITAENFKELMFKTGELSRDIGTTLIGEEAVKHGLIDAVGGLGEALTELNRRIGERRAQNPQAGRVPMMAQAMQGMNQGVQPMSAGVQQGAGMMPPMGPGGGVQ